MPKGLWWPWIPRKKRKCAGRLQAAGLQAIENKQALSLMNSKYLLFMQLFLELAIFVTQDISCVVLDCQLTSCLWMSYFHSIIVNPWMAGTTAILLCVSVNEQSQWFQSQLCYSLMVQRRAGSLTELEFNSCKVRLMIFIRILGKFNGV